MAIELGYFEIAVNLLDHTVRLSLKLCPYDKNCHFFRLKLPLFPKILMSAETEEVEYILNQADQRGKGDTLQALLIEKFPDGEIPKTISGFSALHLAILKGDEKMVSSIEENIEPNWQSDCCLTIGELKEIFMPTLKIAAAPSP